MGDQNIIPTADEFRPVVLRVLEDGKERTFKELCDLAANYAGLSEEARLEELPSGGKRYVNRINWACSGLTQAGLVRRPQRGVYMITGHGQAVNRRGLASYSENDMLEWPQWEAYWQEIRERRNKSKAHKISSDRVVDDTDPVEKIEALVSGFNTEVETRLRFRLQESSPEFFEKAVIELLWAMGYGGVHGEKQHVGGSGDGGIDGVIHQDALGLTSIYVQAKRYADHNSVGTSEIRNFMGALDAHGASLGVFITTSKFLPKAIETAENYRHGKIVLIDGMRLTSLMLAHGVAVQKHREHILYSVDEDFFYSNL